VSEILGQSFLIEEIKTSDKLQLVELKAIDWVIGVA